MTSQSTFRDDALVFLSKVGLLISCQALVVRRHIEEYSNRLWPFRSITAVTVDEVTSCTNTSRVLCLSGFGIASLINIYLQSVNLRC